MVSPSGTVAHNLPVQATSFIGRDRQIGDIIRLLGTARLVTLTGPGGAGKSRLALETGGRMLATYPHGVWLAELAALSDPSLVPHTIAAALGIQETAGRPFAETLTHMLRDREMLVILDNCEHLVSACAHLVQEWVTACPSLGVLATSREALSVPGEAAYPVPPLSLPACGGSKAGALRDSEAARLFEERAAFASPGFTVTDDNAGAVAEICRRLDGIPLAIELAAARVRVLSAGQIAARLNDRFALLAGATRTGLRRHHTLRAAIDWSYDLLDARERVLLRRLSVFAGGFHLDAAERVCPGDGIAREDVLETLGRLIHKSLVTAETHAGEARYRLQDSIRLYARERLLESGERAHGP